jgi:hypothetical protein
VKAAKAGGSDQSQGTTLVGINRPALSSLIGSIADRAGSKGLPNLKMSSAPIVIAIRRTSSIVIYDGP